MHHRCSRRLEVVFILSLLLGLKYAGSYDYSKNLTTLTYGAFCSSSEPHQIHFPSELPEESLPWVWDAVYEQLSRTIIITTIPRKNCLLEFHIVEYFLQQFPQYGKYHTLINFLFMHNFPIFIHNAHN
jgi:hypothetical protein